jgi:ABC-type glycerol-3-phosphate transport system substrate-binding protein
MTPKFTLFCATSTAALFSFTTVAQAETVVRAATGNDAQTALYETMATEYEAANAGIDIQFECIDNESFK